MSIIRIVFSILLAASVLLVGCVSKPPPDPLAGFHEYFEILNQSIVNDYQGYIQKLSPEEKKYLGPYPASFFEDGSGQYAVLIEIGINGTIWEHILIYDKDNKRVKAIKYMSGHYAS